MTDSELQALRNMGNEAEAAAEEIEKLRAANTKLVCAIDLIREALDDGEVQDLRQIINAALAEYRRVQKPSAIQQFGGDLWAGIY